MPEAGGDLVSYFDPRSIDQAHQIISDLSANSELVKDAEQQIASRFIARGWNEVARDYLTTLSDNVTDRKGSTPSIPGSLVFRDTAINFDGTVGPELHERIVAYFSSDLRIASARPCEFESASLSRGIGHWYTPEPWGCWIGMRGAVVELMSSDDDACVAYVSYQVLPTFRDTRLRMKINCEPYFHTASYTAAFGIMAFPIKARSGPNLIEFGPQTISPEQEKESHEIDCRGLFMVLREMTVIRKSDTVGRLDIMQALSGT